MNFKSFESAFDTHVGSCVASCVCGRIFYNPSPEWTWEEGEIKELRADANATQLEYAVGYVEFEGSTYVMDCDCWRTRAEQLMRFLDNHRDKIIKYYRAEKNRLLAEAANMSEI